MQNKKLELIKLTKILEKEKLSYDDLVQEYYERKQNNFSTNDYDYYKTQFERKLETIKKINNRLEKLTK